MFLSVVIITYNEEKNIRRCLESIRAVADEIVIVDSFSTDNTKAICQQYNAHFIQQGFAGYGQQKNTALEYASNDFVLSLDADEVPDEKLVNAIAKVKAGNPGFDGYTMNRCTNYCGGWIRHGTWYPDKKLRLFNRKKIQWSTDPIHETTVIPEGARIQHLPGDILHYSYNSLEEHIGQNNKFSTLSAELYFKKGKKSGWFKILVNPAWAFIQCYLIRCGFMDGFRGFIIAGNVAHLTFMKYYKLYALQKGIRVK